jgi:trimethylamine:corrinoid methyltransferase-like protein
MNQPWTWCVLSDAQISQIREASLTHIERYGFGVQHEALLAQARARGAHVDETQGRVRMSRSLIAELMAQVPPRYTIGNILGETWVIGGAEQYGTAIVTDPWIIDYETREPRHPCLEDLRRNTIVAEQLEPVVSISRMD